MTKQSDGADYIVVGAGSAGCVLANRVSASGRDRVMLLEAGPPNRSPLINMPAGIGLLVAGDKYNYAHETTPQPQLGNRQLFWPRGRTLGGSSSINAMVYIRGNPGDYDAWEAAGNTGWGWSTMRDYFLRAENNSRGRSAHHNITGPLSVSDLRWTSGAGHAFVQAARDAGHPANDDFNAETQAGVGFYQVTQKEGRRCSAADAYLQPALGRPNLRVLTGAGVARVMFHGDRAVGVELLDGRQLWARREVILSAGALQSPQLLMLSGVGDENQLRAHGIRVHTALPGVGRNLHDHLDVTQIARVNRAVTLSNSPWPMLKAIGSVPAYRFRGRGMLTTNGAEAGGFSHSSLAGEYPDLQFHLTSAPLFDHGRDRRWGYGYSLHVCHLRPRSRGAVTLCSADPAVQPLVDAGYLREREDLDVMVEAVRQARDIMEQPPLARLHRAWWQPGQRLAGREAIETYIRDHAESVYHPVGSCRMGIDEQAVVDPQLRVRGLRGLRVVDASVMPSIVSGNTNAPVIAMAERAADLITG